MTNKGEAGFNTINYKGRPVMHDYIDDTVGIINFAHMYRGNATDLFNGTPSKGRHACLIMGYWCWQNFEEYPMDLLPYLRKKTRQPWLIP